MGQLTETSGQDSNGSVAAPNLVSPTAVYGKTIGYAVTTSMVAFLSNAAASGKSFKVISVYLANIDGVVGVEVTLEWFDGTTARKVGNAIVVPGKGTQVIIGRDSPIYLEEGHSLRAQAGAAGDLEIVCSYEEIS